MSWYNWIRSQEYDAAVREIKSTHRLKHMDSTLFFRLEDETKHYQTDQMLRRTAKIKNAQHK